MPNIQSCTNECGSFMLCSSAFSLRDVHVCVQSRSLTTCFNDDNINTSANCVSATVFVSFM